MTAHTGLVWAVTKVVTLRVRNWNVSRAQAGDIVTEKK